MEPQSASAVLLVRPAAFGFHAEAAQSNAFATPSADPDLQRKALAEFDGLARALDNAGVEVLVLDDTPDPARPDATFPNNWLSTHADGTLVVYPMATPARRLERRVDDVTALLIREGFAVRRIVNLSGHERQGHFLEGTGSLVLDRPNRRAFASRSPRTSEPVLDDFERQLGYAVHAFNACDRSGRAIYHTNVLLSLGSDFAVLCTKALSAEDRLNVTNGIEGDGRTLIEVDYDQMGQFACNVIELRSRRGEPVIGLSSAALASYRPDEIRWLEQFGTLVAAAIPTIKSVGGGSVRCMIAEIHLPRG